MKGYLSAAGALVVGLAASQLPAFDQQYTQRLGGAMDELRIITERFDATADQAGLTRAEALTRFSASGDTFLAGHGADMAATFTRYARLQAHLVAIEGADPISRTLDLTRFYDPEIGARALESFEPAVPVTVEGFGFLGAGLIAGYAAFWALFSLIALPFRRKRVAYR